MAHSADTLENHKEWINNIMSCNPEITGYFPIPIVADPSRNLAAELGIFDNYRAVYIIDPNKKVRLSMFYPMSTGINFNELLRSIDSLQVTDRLKVVATPADWTLGEKVMILPDVTDKDAAKLFPGGIDCVKMPSGQNYVRTTTDYNSNIMHKVECSEMNN